MADGTVRGVFELSGDQPVRTLHDIRDAGAEADAMLDRLGQRLDAFGRKRANATVGITGFDRVNAQLSELEARLDRLDRRRVSSHVSLGGGFSNIAGGGGGGMVSSAGGGGGGSPLLSSLGGVGGTLPWWALAVPFAPALAGGAGALAGSAVSAGLGVGTIGLGAAGALGAGAAGSLATIKPTLTAIQQVTQAQTKLNQVVAEYGRTSTQAKNAQLAYNAALVANPGAVAPARQLGLLRSEFQSATAPGRAAVSAGVSNVLYNARRGVAGGIGADVNTASTATARSATTLSGFLVNAGSLNVYRQLTSAFATELPIMENTLEHVLRTFENLSVAALPFFHEANVWVNSWTGGMARSSADTARVQEKMSGMVQSAKDWGRLLLSAEHVLRDIFSPGVTTGDSLVVQLTHTLDHWDTWLRGNPQKVHDFFATAGRDVDKIATTVGNLAGDLFKILQWIQPIVSEFTSLAGIVSGLGPGGLLGGAGLLYGAYQGARGALGGRGPSAGAVASSVILGSGGPMVSSARNARMAGGVIVGGANEGALRAQQAEFARAHYLMAPAGFQTARAGAVGDQLPLFAAGAAGYAYRGARAAPLMARGEVAFNQAYGSVQGARYAPLEAGRAVPMAELAGPAGIIGTAGAALAGAAKFLAPIMALTSVLQAAQQGGSPGHIANNALASFGSQLTLGTVSQQSLAKLPLTGATGGGILGLLGGRFASGLVPKLVSGVTGAGIGTLAQALISPATTGTSLSNASTRAGINNLVSQASAARSPQDLKTIQQQVNFQLRYGAGELPPGDERKIQAVLQRAVDTAAQNVGATASNTWQNAFVGALDRGEKPQKAVTTMLSGINSQLQSMLPKARAQTAKNIATWVGQLEQSQPQMRKPLERLMNGIIGDLNRLQSTTGTTMRDLQNKVFYFNGQILTGTQTTWGAISDAMTNPAKVAQEKLLGIWGAIQSEAINALTQMGFTKNQAHDIVTATAQGGRVAAAQSQIVGAKVTTGTTISQGAALSPGGSPGTAGLKARGGVIDGRGLLDTVPTPDGGLAAPGEAWIANRHAMNDLSRATLAYYGKTAWELIRDEDRMHSAPPAGSRTRALRTQYSYRGGRNRHSLGGLLGQAAGAVGAGATQAIGGAASAGGGQNPYIYGYSRVEPVSRVDQGLDFTGAGPIFAIGSGRVIDNSLWPGWPGSGGVVYTLDSGPYAGRNVYNMEHVRAAVSVGQHVTPGQYIGDVLAGYPWLEAGWANSAGTGPLTPYNGAADGTPMPAGQQFKALMMALRSGGKLPSGASLTTAGGSAGAPIPQISIKAPRSGLRGVPGAMADQASRIMTAGLQAFVNKKIGAMTPTGGAAPGGRAGTVAGPLVTASWFDDPQTASGHTHVPGFAELSNPPGSLNFSALGHLPFGRIIESSFGGTTIRVPKVDVGAGGSAVPPATVRGIDFTREAAMMLPGFIAAGLGNVTWRDTGQQAFSRGGISWGGWNRRGGDFTTHGPTLFGAGEGGRRERVQISPASTPTRNVSPQIAVNFNAPVTITSGHDIEQLGVEVAQKILDALDNVAGGASDKQLMAQGAGSS